MKLKENDKFNLPWKYLAEIIQSNKKLKWTKLGLVMKTIFLLTLFDLGNLQ